MHICSWARFSPFCWRVPVRWIIANKLGWVVGNSSSSFGNAPFSLWWPGHPLQTLGWAVQRNPPVSSSGSAWDPPPHTPCRAPRPSVLKKAFLSRLFLQDLQLTASEELRTLLSAFYRVFSAHCAAPAEEGTPPRAGGCPGARALLGGAALPASAS